MQAQYAKMINLKNGQVRVLYTQWFGDDQYVADFDNQADAIEMMELVNMPGLTINELKNLGFTI